MMGFPAVLLYALIAFRTCSDAGIEWLTGFTKRGDLPRGLARVLSRTSKQSVAALEAEFDALKERGSEVDKLVEMLIHDVRGAREWSQREGARSAGKTRR